ncbi:hypothetical protein [Cryptosporidium hominis TU502]|uniref:hypothetical protein n=1 Tax=Cryptosporidium hominis (strain TU502) TaxID=353151 RepID=UPI0000452F2D|nr:hypothetical protein [Cryptosporidium hominis TU502]
MAVKCPNSVIPKLKQLLLSSLNSIFPFSVSPNKSKSIPLNIAMLSISSFNSPIGSPKFIGTMNHLLSSIVFNGQFSMLKGISSFGPLIRLHVFKLYLILITKFFLIFKFLLGVPLST